MEKEIARGAEAVLFKTDKNTILKHRQKKSYRISEIDQELRTKRTRHEARILEKLGKKGFNVPRLLETDSKEKIFMENIEGKQLKYLLDDKVKLAKKVGELLAELHDNDIIHSDLTTSNIILNNQNKLFFIDFGLSFYSTRIEDKAVDIHLFLQSLESRHYKIKEKAFSEFLIGYKNCREYQKVLKQLETVQSRGRHKKK